jgi:Protein of unknown function (DUF4242)
MPRYLIEQEYPEGFSTSFHKARADLWRRNVEGDYEVGVTCVHSYATPDLKRMFHIYDGPSPDAIRRVAGNDERPIANMTEIRVLDPFSF